MFIYKSHLFKAKNIAIHNYTSDISSEYASSSICAVTSYFEGFSLVLLEAMKHGVPCVAFDCPFGPRNIIRNGEDGLLIDYLNTKALADGICRLIEDKELRSAMGCRARENILRFSREHVMQQWVDLFDSLLKGKEA